MLKKLDLLLLRTFVGPFFGATFIISIILILQFFWKYLDDMAGKGLGVWVIFKLTMYLGATVLPMSLPIAVLFASLFTFGGMGERSELVAIKAAGISFIRFLRPVLFLAIIISAIAFWFSNNVIPYSTMRFQNILYEIVYQKPAFDLKPGVFYDKIDGYTIYINHKTDDEKTLNKIIIFEAPKNINTPFRNIIFANKGHLKIGEDSSHKQVLIFSLYDGAFYQERGTFNHRKNDFTMTNFTTFRKVLDMSSFKFMEDKSQFKNHQTMNIQELDSALKETIQSAPYNTKYNQFMMENHFPLLKGVPFLKATNTNKALKQILPTDTISASTQKAIQEKINMILNAYSNYETEMKNWHVQENKFRVEWHKKFTLSLSCFIFFLIGSALGAIIRKGGMGLPLIIAVGMLVFYFFLSSALEKASKVGEILPVIGMWLSNAILLPIGVFLSYKALNDSQLLNKEAYQKAYEKMIRLFNKSSNK